MAKGPRRKKSHLGQPEQRPQGILDTVFRGLLVPLALEALLIPFRPVIWLLRVVSQPFVWLFTWKQRRQAEALLARKRYLEGAEFKELLDSADDAIGRLLSLRDELKKRDVVISVKILELAEKQNRRDLIEQCQAELERGRAQIGSVVNLLHVIARKKCLIVAQYSMAVLMRNCPAEPGLEKLVSFDVATTIDIPDLRDTFKATAERLRDYAAEVAVERKMVGDAALRMVKKHKDLGEGNPYVNGDFERTVQDEVKATVQAFDRYQSELLGRADKLDRKADELEVLLIKLGRPVVDASVLCRDFPDLVRAVSLPTTSEDVIHELDSEVLSARLAARSALCDDDFPAYVEQLDSFREQLEADLRVMRELERNGDLAG